MFSRVFEIFDINTLPIHIMSFGDFPGNQLNTDMRDIEVIAGTGEGR
jgi:hypothetical protein